MKLLNTSEFDVIKIMGLTANGRHGVYPYERRDGQPFRVDVIMHVDTRSAANEDDLSRTVDYSEVAADVNAILAGPPVYLIETLAQRVAEAVLQHEAVQIVEVEVHKPDAPMNYEFNDVSMTIRRTRDEVQAARREAGARDGGASDDTSASRQTAASPVGRATLATVDEDDDLTRSPHDEVRAVIALGANMGDAWQTLAQAVLALDGAPGVSIAGVSALFRTAPVLAPGQASQDDYYNAVAEVRTSLSPLGLLSVCQQIEDEFGRVRTEHWGPRTLDLDIITYEGVRSDDPQLTLPHPRAHERAFVLEPWLQVDRNATVGRHGRVDVLVEQVRDQRIENVADFWVEEASQGTYPGKQRDVQDPAPSDSAQSDASLNGDVSAVYGAPSDTRPIPRVDLTGDEPVAKPPIAREPGTSERLSAGTLPTRASRHGRRRLPKWHPLKPRRIVDDASELYRIEPETARPTGRHARSYAFENHDEVPARPRTRQRPRMESGLAEDFATGLLPISEEPKRMSRRTIVRPTVTGAIPITKPNGHGERGEAES
ncbi:MAG: 2-amino-4-hydroxy-6-hydroxymethyldihydropteridine diphosphokinase [Actinomycetaceae bacterium]|nr:2-amino-4-hydroxy-6-hydroxymethyldihydropteridine diphosphokinase [Actinomycetaceae bacterium]